MKEEEEATGRGGAELGRKQGWLRRCFDVAAGLRTREAARPAAPAGCSCRSNRGESR